jgi:hypothetical protein
MRKALLLGIAIIAVSLTSCIVDVSEGAKFGTLQKLSTKHWPCQYYVAEFAYEGGRVTKSTTDDGTFANTQQVELDKAAFDSLQDWIGDKVIFEYKDKGYEGCGESKYLTSIRHKK